MLAYGYRLLAAGRTTDKQPATRNQRPVASKSMKRYIILTIISLVFILSRQTGSADSWHEVKWVVDGDTVVLNDGQKVRYISKKFNALLVNRKKVRLEFDRERFDRYQRLLAYVFLKNAAFVNAELLSNGYAYLLRHRPNLKYDEILLQSQRSAMSAKKGIWQNWKENKNTVVGNKNSHRFHLRTCPYGKRIKPQNRIVFQKKWDAYWEGYAPAKRCMPVFEIPEQ